MNNLAEILEGIKSGDISYGEDKDFYFMTDEDSILFFLQRNYELTEDEDGEPRTCWSQYDDVIIWQTSTGNNRGIDITEQFLNALDIDFAG